jgi:hypothetical protein
MVVVARVSPFFLLIQALILVVTGFIIFSLTKITLLDYSRVKGDDFQQDSLTHFSSAAPWQTLKELKDSKVKMLVELKREDQMIFFQDLFSVGILFLFSLWIISLIFSVKVKLTDDFLEWYLPGIPFFSKPLRLAVKEIKTVRINRVTPFSGDPQDFSRLSWRDVLVINNFYLAGYFFSNLGKIYQQLILMRPDLKPEYTKNTAIENLRSSLNQI